jgi:hypothetical protein
MVGWLPRHTPKLKPLHLPEPRPGGATQTDVA